MTRWEYLIVAECQYWDGDAKEFETKYWIARPGDDDWQELEQLKMNTLGEEGWELVNQLIRENGILLNVKGLHTGGVAVDIRHTFKRSAG